jgi:arsenite methyltransferase
MRNQPDYGIDAPGVIRNLSLVAIAILIVAMVFPRVSVGSVVFLLRPMAWTIAPAFALGALLMLIYAKQGKFQHRDRMLSLISWAGSETVLDVGTGRGLLMIGAAKRLSTGRSVGIDIWSGKDLSGNTPENARHNAHLEGVGERVEIRSEDATRMTFADNSFDVILSNLCLHNIPHKKSRAKACREIVRVLKPGGVALISDFIHLGEYADAFRGAGAQANRAGWFWLDTFPPMGILRVTKDESG